LRLLETYGYPVPMEWWNERPSLSQLADAKAVVMERYRNLGRGVGVNSRGEIIGVTVDHPELWDTGGEALPDPFVRADDPALQYAQQPQRPFVGPVFIPWRPV